MQQFILISFVLVTVVVTSFVPAPMAKKPFVGLVSMGVPGNTSIDELYVHPNVYVGYVIEANWVDLAPTNSTYNFSFIDTMLREIYDYNQNASTILPVRAKIRVHTAGVTPQWVFDQIGGPITYYRCDRVGTQCSNITVSLFWTQQYRAVWRNLVNQLASVYDTNPLVAEIAVSSCSSSSAEPFVIDPTAFNNIYPNYGFTWSAYEACLLGAIDDYASWNITPIDYTFNTLPIPPSGNVTFTISVMQQFRQRYGNRAVIANHALHPTAGTPNDTQPYSQEFYGEFSVLGSPVEFQAFSANGNTGGNSTPAWNSTIWLGLSHYNMTEMEMFVSRDARPSGDGQFNLTELQYWASLFTQLYPNWTNTSQSSQ